MNVLFIHQNFPGQFIHLSADLAKDPNNRVVAMTIEKRPVPTGVEVRPYTLLRETAQDTHFLLRDAESKVLRGEACAAAALQLKRDGFEPDIIIAHPGWGEALFMKDVFPHTKLVIYCEYYYAAEGQDVGFDPEDPPLTFPQRCQLRLKNTTNLLCMEMADAGISPTHWQKKSYPDWAQKKITVIHDGIDLQRLTYNPDARLQLIRQNGNATVELRPGDEVLSYVARNLEPVRGFHVFMRTLPEVLRRRPLAHAVIVGGDDIGYGQRAPGGLNWKEYMLREVGEGLDLSRVHFLGQVGYKTYLQLLSISRVHAYWTTPFVLSWSFLEAAASGLPVIASNTAPVLEYAGQFGVKTLDFFNLEGFASALTDQLANPARGKPAHHNNELSVRQCLKRQREWLASI